MSKKAAYMGGGAIVVLVVAVASASVNGVDDTLALFEGLLAIVRGVL